LSSILAPNISGFLKAILCVVHQRHAFCVVSINTVTTSWEAGAGLCRTAPWVSSTLLLSVRWGARKMFNVQKNVKMPLWQC
jgi:hypothetical protein